MNKVTFEEFANAVVEKIREYLPESFKNASVELNTVKKNNNVTLTGITIKTAGNNIAPTIYLEQFYDKYQDGEDMGVILSHIADVRVNHEVSDAFDVAAITDFTRVKDKIIARLVNRDWNSRILEDRPHTLIADLAVTYHILLDGDVDGMASVAITNQLFKDWDLDIQELHELAVNNMKRLLPGYFKPMSAVLAEMMGADPEDILQGMNPEDETMFVLTNEKKVFGAACLLDKELMESIVEQLGDIYVLPSSVHECILVPVTIDMEPEMLADMIDEVNDSQVEIVERLGNRPYIYSIKDGLRLA